VEKTKKKQLINYIILITVFLFGVFVLGPIVEGSVIDPMKPYLLVDKDEFIAASTMQCKSCDLPPVLPLEMRGMTSDKPMRLPIDRAPIEYLPYIHYPESWDEWWNPFQPYGIGPPLRITLNFLVPISAVAVLVYGIIVWRRGGFKEFMRKLKP
jgi:hypothetical protein